MKTGLRDLLNGIRMAYNWERDVFPDDDHLRFAAWGRTPLQKARWFILYAVHGSWFPSKWFWLLFRPILGDWWKSYQESIKLPDGFWRKA